MSCTPLSKAAKPAWAKQLARLPCLVIYIKFQFPVLVLTYMVSPSTVMEDVRGFVWVNRLAWSTAKNVGIMRMHLHFYSVR